VGAPPGTVCSTSGGSIIVAAGGGTSVELVELQRAGSKRLGAAAFAAGSPLAPGERLGV
jgi:methionyl-tRNA formyltransferase